MNIAVSHNLILPKYLIIVKEKGSKISKTHARESGASVFSSLLSFLSLLVPPFTRQKNLRAKLKQAGKKEGGWGEGIFARMIRFVGAMELEAFPPFWYQNINIGGGSIGVRIFVKKSSNFVQKTPPIFTFCEIIRNSLGAKRLDMVFPRENPSIFEGERKHPLGNAEVPVRKHRVPQKWDRTNLFSFAFGERLSVFFFDCLKTNLKTIWTT